MKHTKRLIGIILTFAMMLAMTVTAFAAEGTLKVVDPGNAVYTAYKVFDAAVDQGTGETSYTLSNTAWISVLVDADKPGQAADGVKGLTFEGNAAPYTVVKGNTYDAADFAAFLKANIPAEAVGETVSGTAASLPAGYYLVVSSTGEKAMLTTVLDDTKVQIQDKNDMPFDKGIVDGSDLLKEKAVQVGETVSFRINGKVPVYPAPAPDPDWETYIYQVFDTMDNGLTFNKDSFAVSINGTAVALEEIEDQTAILTGDQVRFDANGKTFELSLGMLARSKDADIQGKDIVISYTAVVNENASGKVSENNAVLEYGSDPSDLTVKDTQTKVYTSRLVIDKFETGAPEQKLAGASFKLYKLAADGETQLFYNVDQQGVVTWDAEGIVMTTDEDGFASFEGLTDGTYYLVETKSPAGYSRIREAITVTVDGSSATSVGLSADQIVLALTQVENIANTPGTNLPSTGGIGTVLFYLAGAAIIIGAIAAYIRRQKAA